MSLWEIGRKTVKGSIIIAIGNISTLAISAVGAIIVARLLGPENYGLYSTWFSLASLFYLLGDWGLNAASVKYIAAYLAENRKEKAGSSWLIISAWKLLFSLLTSLILFFSAECLSINIYKTERLVYPLKVGSLLVFGLVMIGYGFSIFQAHYEMAMISEVNVLQAVIRTITSPLLIVIGFGLMGAIYGQVFSYLLPLVVVAYFFRSIKRKTYENNLGETGALEIPPAMWLEETKKFFSYGFPLAVSNIAYSSFPQALFLMLSILSTFEQTGYFTAAFRITTISAMILYSLATSLFPSFVEISTREDRDEALNHFFSRVVNYSAIFIFPLGAGMTALAYPIIGFLYSPSFLPASQPLIFLGLAVMINGLGQVTNSLLAAIGETKKVAVINVSRLCMGVGMNFLLIPLLQASGASISVVFAAATAAFLGFHFVKKAIGFTLDKGKILRIFFSSLSMGLSVLVVDSMLENFVLSVIVCIPLGAILYLLFSLLFGGINKRDVEELKKIVGSREKYRKIFFPILNLLYDFSRDY